MQRDKKQHRGASPPRGWQSMRGHEETYAFIVRLHLSVAADGSAVSAQFSFEDVTAGSMQRFTTFALAAERLSDRIQEILSGPVTDQGPS